MNTNANVHTDPISYKRYHFLDFIRGFTLINMILYHGTYDLVYLYNVSIPAYESRGGYLWQQAICWTFIFLSGISFHFGKKHLKQAILLTLAGLLITIVTAILMPQFPVFMGIALAFALNPLVKFFRKIPFRGGQHLPQAVAILLSFVVFGGLIYFLVNYLLNLKYSVSSCFLPLRKSEAISIPMTEKVIPFPPNPKTK